MKFKVIVAGVEMDAFPVGVGEKLKFYVYRLIDPRNGETFYIGKGKNDRIFQHAKATKSADVTIDVDTNFDLDEPRDDDKSLKISRLNEIHRAGLDVIHVVHRHGIEDPKTAFEVEAALIDAFAGLSNVSGGHHSTDRGPMHALQIADKYALPELALRDDKLILININSADHGSTDELLDRTRYAWRISRQRAEKAQYVLAVIHGVVHGVFVPTIWYPATAEHFPSDRFGATDPLRLGFHGLSAPAGVWEHYVGLRGKRLPEGMRHGQNPIRYHNC
ncbi:LEM-3-like GIY-YIG domain-containing protein [Sulfitobacter sp. M13]